MESFDLTKPEERENLFEKMVRFKKSHSFMSCSIRYASYMYFTNAYLVVFGISAVEFHRGMK